MKLTIVIPAYNEEQAITTTLDGLRKGVNIPHEIIVVNDHSKDNTRSVVLDLAKKYQNIKLIDNNNLPGITNALKAGFECVKEGAIAAVMADACDEPDTINKMYEKIIDGYEVVCASRYMTGGKRLGRPTQGFFSKSVGLALYYFIGIPTHDSSNAFKMYRKEALDKINIEEAGFASALEITVKAFIAGFRIAEVPTTWKKREAGESKFRITNAAKNYFYWFFWSLFAKLFKKG
ncbi:MAG: glycosyltransferase [Candidatus Omnitrophica bacterium]|nr:glycosyltransferase [Candidatus Omnitrophota bacterium]